MSGQSLWAVVPVKPFVAAKQRLSPLLSRAECAELARLMLRDVLEVLAGCTALSGTMVVTADSAAGHIAAATGAKVLDDPAHDLNGAVREAVGFLSSLPHAGMIVIPSDVPLLSSAVLDAVVDSVSCPPAVALVPASRDGGTNLLACKPADAIAPGFGADSFRRHCSFARRAGFVPTVIASDDAGLDIDRPDDLAALLAQPATSRSQAFLATLNIPARLRGDALRDRSRPFASLRSASR